MVLTFAGAGLYFGRTPTASTSESTVGMASSGMPWETGASEGKYRYHPGGDPSQAPQDAPSAVNVVVVPDVTLPKVCARATPKHGGGRIRTRQRRQRRSFSLPPLHPHPISPTYRTTPYTLTAPTAPARQVQQVGQGGLLGCLDAFQKIYVF